ncbi:MAG: prepilin-type N-terminal cleavage/methylation domain-containing protein [Candidatus Moranbacteria bacterium]|nr:prepilin-type N-terminal cleavage/methylation domain-containing protein [Candidatus Moranbacteria bacterium]
MIQNSKLKIKNSSRGFTLIEIIIAIAIVGIVSGIAVVNFGKNDDKDVRMERERLTSFLRDVQNKALTGEIVAGVSGVCGFGVHYVSSSKIQAYYTTHGTDCKISGSKTYGTDLQDVFNVRNGVTVNSSFSDVFFLIPNGEVYDNGTPMATPVTLTLTKNTSIGITIDAAGNIKNID